jgi:hypothetical protein
MCEPSSMRPTPLSRCAFRPFRQGSGLRSHGLPSRIKRWRSWAATTPTHATLLGSGRPSGSASSVAVSPGGMTEWRRERARIGTTRARDTPRPRRSRIPRFRSSIRRAVRAKRVLRPRIAVQAVGITLRKGRPNPPRTRRQVPAVGVVMRLALSPDPSGTQPGTRGRARNVGWH